MPHPKLPQSFAPGSDVEPHSTPIWFPAAYINAPANIRIYRIFRCWDGRALLPFAAASVLSLKPLC